MLLHVLMEHYRVINGEDRYLDIPNKDYTYSDILNLNNSGDIVKFDAISSNPNNAKGAFNESNPELRKISVWNC